MSNKVRVGVLGVGNMGSVHCQNIVGGKCPELLLTAVADINPERLNWAKTNLGDDVKLFQSSDELIESGLCEAVIIAVPHYLHPGYAIKCFDKGIHVLTEKPAGVYTKQVKEMISAYKKSNVVFGIMFNQRTNCIYRAARDIIKSGRLGEIRRTNWIITNWYRSQAYYDSGSWRATWKGEGGGVLLNQCPHQLDLWQWICGMPEKVEAHMGYGKWHDIEVEDDVTCYVEYPNGATGTFITTTGDSHGVNRLEITLSKGKVLIEDGKLSVWEYEEDEREYLYHGKAYTPVPAKKIDVPTDGKNEQHVGVLNAFASAILHGTDLVACGEEGLNGLTLSNAMHLSSWLGKMISLPFDDDLYYNELMKRASLSHEKQNVKPIFNTDTDCYKRYNL